ncbi:hypothetical protein [Tepidanaerobacter sp. EBM-38]|nr:hypothetical protein [Tepidanaerobacter sp. EBM-38]
MTYSDALWQEAKKKCRLNNEDIKIAKELGLNQALSTELVTINLHLMC